MSSYLSISPANYAKPWSAVPLAERYGGKIILVHVVQPPAVLSAIPAGGQYLVPMDNDKAVNTAKAHLEGLAAKLVPTRLLARMLVRQGNPYNEIISAARNLKVDLIVLATHGYGDSSVRSSAAPPSAWCAMRIAPCWQCEDTDRRGDNLMRKSKTRFSQPPRPWRRILVPIDFSKNSLRALDITLPLARDNGARLFLLFVIELAAFAAGSEGSVLAVPGATLAKEAMAKLPKLANGSCPPQSR